MFLVTRLVWYPHLFRTPIYRLFRFVCWLLLPSSSLVNGVFISSSWSPIMYRAVVSQALYSVLLLRIENPFGDTTALREGQTPSVIRNSDGDDHWDTGVFVNDFTKLFTGMWVRLFAYEVKCQDHGRTLCSRTYLESPNRSRVDLSTSSSIVLTVLLLCHLSRTLLETAGVPPKTSRWV